MTKKLFISPKIIIVFIQGTYNICSPSNPVPQPGKEDENYNLSPARKLYV